MSTHDESGDRAAMERRRFLSNLAKVAWGPPVIVSLLHEEPAYAQACATLGQSCGTPRGLSCTVTTPCCSGLSCTSGLVTCTCL